MSPQTYNSLTEAERIELNAIADRWQKWALAHIGAHGDYWNGLTLREREGGWVIHYMSEPTPFLVKSQRVGGALVEDAQTGLSKL